MKYPVEEQKIIEAFKVHLESENMVTTQDDEDLIKIIVRMLNKAYIVGLNCGLKCK